MTTDTRPPVAPKPGYWCRRRDGKAFYEFGTIEDDVTFEGSDNVFREPGGRVAGGIVPEWDCIGIIGPICAGCDCTDGRCTRQGLTREQVGRMLDAKRGVAAPPDAEPFDDREWCNASPEDRPLIEAYMSLDWRVIDSVRQAVRAREAAAARMAEALRKSLSATNQDERDANAALTAWDASREGGR